MREPTTCRVCGTNQMLPLSGLSPDRRVCSDCILQTPPGSRLGLIVEAGAEGAAPVAIRGEIVGEIDVFSYWHGRLRPRPGVMVRSRGRRLVLFPDEILDVVDQDGIEDMEDAQDMFGRLTPNDEIDGASYRRLHPHRKLPGTIAHYELVDGDGNVVTRHRTQEQGLSAWHDAIDAQPGAALLRVLDSGQRQVVADRPHVR